MDMLTNQPNLFPNPTFTGLWCISCYQLTVHFLDPKTMRITCNSCGWFKTDLAIGPKIQERPTIR